MQTKHYVFRYPNYFYRDKPYNYNIFRDDGELMVTVYNCDEDAFLAEYGAKYGISEITDSTKMDKTKPLNILDYIKEVTECKRTN